MFVRDLVADTTTLVSVDADSGQGDASSREPALSADGQVVAFESNATNLIVGDPDTSGNFEDIFVRLVDDPTTIVRASDDAAGGRSDDDSESPDLSADGRFVVFDSQASDLLPGGDTATNDVYRRDLDTGSLVQVSLDVDGGPTNGFSDKESVSADGRYVAFACGATDLVVGVGSTGNYYVRDVLVHTTTLVSVNDQGRAVGGGGGNARLLPDASGVTFDTSAPALPDDDNGVRDVYLRTGLQYPANRPPVANAGPDQTVREDRSTTLDGRRSQDPEHAPSPSSGPRSAARRRRSGTRTPPSPRSTRWPSSRRRS